MTNIWPKRDKNGESFTMNDFRGEKLVIGRYTFHLVKINITVTKNDIDSGQYPKSINILLESIYKIDLNI